MNNLYFGYESYIASFRMQFGIAVAPPTFEEYVRFYTVNQLPYAAASVETNSFEKEPTAAPEIQQQTTASGKTKRERCGEDQASVLVSSWKTHFGLVESHKSHAGWIKIQIEVNAAGPLKSVKQCKDKLRNLKDAYKAACDNNKQTGAEPKFPPFYDTFDEIFATRDVINMPNVLDSGHINRKTDIDNNNNSSNSNINDNSYNSCKEDETYDGTNEQSNESDTISSQDINDIEEEDNDIPKISNDMQVPGTPKQLRKSAKSKRKREGKTDFREELIDLQKKQLDAFKEQTANSEAAMQQLFEKQLKHEEREREKDRQLLLQLGQIMSQK